MQLIPLFLERKFFYSNKFPLKEPLTATLFVSKMCTLSLNNPSYTELNPSAWLSSHDYLLDTVGEGLYREEVERLP